MLQLLSHRPRQVLQRLLIVLLAVAAVCTAWLSLGPITTAALRDLLWRVPARVDRTANRAARLNLVRAVRVNDTPIDIYCGERCHVLWSTPPGEGILNITAPAPAADGSRTLSFTPEQAQALFATSLNAEFRGTCAQVTADGYLLTAAHCLDAGRDLHVAITRPDGNVFRKARVVHVWGEPVDLALLKIDEASPAWLPLGDPAPVAVGDTVVSAGMLLKEKTESNTRALELDLGNLVEITAGRITKVEPIEGQPGFTSLTADLPLVPGESGGPMIDTSGRLVAINTRTSVVPRDVVRPLLDAGDVTSIATAIESVRVETLIKGDRERHDHFE